jgi:hypothetical protein
MLVELCTIHAQLAAVYSADTFATGASLVDLLSKGLGENE